LSVRAAARAWGISKSTATIPVGTGPGGVAITPDGTRAYVTNLGSHSVSVIDIATNTVVDTISAVNFPARVAIIPDGSRAYVTAGFSVSVIDTATNTVIADITLPGQTFEIAIAPDGSGAYVGTFGLNAVIATITVIDTATDTVSATLSDGVTCPSGFFGPYGIAITPASLVPTSKEDCKNGGYRRFGPPAGPFRNQGQCISYVQNRSDGRN
jgi:YVTN family beta-propeller protein